MRVLVCGSRYAEENDEVRNRAQRVVAQVLNELRAGADIRDSEFLIIHGAAEGIDTIAADWVAVYATLENNVRMVEYPADWRLGKKAGPIRNQLMLDKGKPDLVVAFHDMPSLGKGTKDMVVRAMKAKIPVRLYWY